jgi:hypothetical protein
LDLTEETDSMTPTSPMAVTAWLAVLGLGMAGCLCPPCPGAPGAAPPNNAGNAMNAGPAAPAAPVASGSKLMIWDGDGAGSGAQSWEACDKAPNCEVKVGADPGSGVNGSTALKMHGKGPGFIGLGWNIFGWYPENAGIDLTPYTHLTFQIRIDAKTPADAPDPGSVGILLGCSKVKKDSATLPVERYAKGFSDGKWHKVSMPISAFVKGPGAQFDLGSFWEFRVATWSMSPRNFDLYIDEIAAEKQ